MAENHRKDIIFALALALGLYLAWVLRATILLIFVGALLAVVLMPPINAVRRIRIGRWSPGRGGAIVIVLLIVLGIIAVTVVLLLPPIIRDTKQFAAEWPQRLAQLSAKMENVPILRRFSDKVNPQSIQNLASEVFSRAFRAFSGVASSIVALVTLAILTAYFMVDGERCFRWAMSMFPVEQRARLEPTLCRAKDRLGRWLLGQATLMLILGCSSTLVFFLLGIKYFYVLGLIAGLANFVPVLGAVTSLVLASVIAAMSSWMKMLGVIIFSGAYHWVENAYLTPRIMRSRLDLPGIAIIIALLLGGELAGVLGAIIAVPTAALAAVLIEEYLVKKDGQIFADCAIEEGPSTERTDRRDAA